MAKFTWDSNTVTAFAAVLLAAAAFIVAFLQVILEYMSSSTTRNLCSPQAIGVSAHQTKYSWNFGSWKLRVFYPLIKMDTGTLLLLFMSSEQRSISRVPELRRIAKAHDWRWRAIESSESIDRNTIADDLTCMIARGRNGKSGGLITAKDLDWNEWFVFQWYRFRHPLRKFGRPRSSWAQLITALGIRDTRSLTIEVVDAETVPASMDTPIQRVKLRQIGVLAFILGFQSVELDIPNRFFRALSPFGTITTQLNNVLGKVLRFEGDLVAFRSLISRCEAEWVFRGRDLIHGQQSFGKYLTSATYYPLYTLHRAMVDNLPTGVYDDEERADIIAAGRGYSTGPAYLEATIMRRFLMRILEKQEVQLHSLKRRMTDQEMDQPERRTRSYDTPETQLRSLIVKDNDDFAGVFEGCMAQWQAKTGSNMPTIYAAASFMTINGVVCGHPSRSLLYPFIPWVRRRAKHFYSMNPSPFRVSTELSKAMTQGTLTWARESSLYLLGSGIGSSDVGTYGWGINKMRDIYDGMPSTVQREVIPNEEKWEVNAVLTPDTYKLLRKFELDSWSLSIREAGQINLLDYQAINCLWIQILVLDIAIQFLIHGHWGFEAMQDAKGDAMLANLKKAKASANGQDAGELVRLHNPLYCESWGKKEAAVVGGIVKAWRPPMLREGEGEMELVDDEDDEKKGETMDWKLLGLRLRDWDLAQGLIEEPNIVFGDDPASRSSVSKSDMCKRLAELLELRAIFVIAFLFLHPDSSEIYESQRKEEDIEMPMA